MIKGKSIQTVLKKNQVLLKSLFPKLPIISSRHRILVGDSRTNNGPHAQKQTVGKPSALERGSSNNCIPAKPSPLFASADKVLGEHGHIHSNVVCGIMNSYDRDWLAHKPNYLLLAFQRISLLIPALKLSNTVSTSQPPHVATEHLKCSLCQLRCAVSVKHTPNFKDFMKKRM